MRHGEFLIYAGSALGVPEGKRRTRFLSQIEAFVKFCQNQGLMRRVLLKKRQRATISTNVVRSDVTDKGYRFFKAAYGKWSEAVKKGTLDPEESDFLIQMLARIGGTKAEGKRATTSDVGTTCPDFELTPEDSVEYEAAGPRAYDKADWHIEGQFPDDLPEQQANVHTGLFIAWLSDHDLCAGEFRLVANRVKRRLITGPQAYHTWGGILVSDMLTEEGNKFASDYYDGKFDDDYRELLVRELPSFYHVADNWENYQILKRRIDKRFQTWKSKR